MLMAGVACVVVLAGMQGCPKQCPEYDPDFDAADFVSGAGNPFMPLVPGTTFIYEKATDEGTEVVVVEVTHDTVEILGVTCIVVHDTESLDGELLEDTFDWFASDEDGNVWYFGEDSTEYEDGLPVSTEGSWEAGVDGALPGIVMLGDPQAGDLYREEFLCGEAEDEAIVVSLDASVDVPYGSFDNCLRTENFTRLEPGAHEDKYYAPGVGLVLEVEGNERVELISVTTE